MNRHIDPLETRKLMAADLAVTAVTLADSAGGTDGYIRYSVTVTNLGDEAVGSGRTSVRTNLSADNRFANSGNDKSLNVGIISTHLAPGASTTIDFTYSGTSNNVAGFYKLIAAVDANDTVEESNENNNVTASSTFTYYEPIADSFLISGTSRSDVVSLYTENDRAIAVVNGQVFGRRLSGIPASGLNMNLGRGDDRVVTAADFPVKLDVFGGDGNDSILGGAADDVLSGGGGKDRIAGQGGDDRLSGGGSNDFLDGGDGNDTLDGGAANDILIGSAGVDVLRGGIGTDYLYDRDGNQDLLDGGDDDDLAFYDRNDTRVSIEGAIVR
jgi:Ca2+-binding RTX toxin-like protein